MRCTAKDVANRTSLPPVMGCHPVLGLTGNIGAGKSTVGALLRALGARVIDSDQTVGSLLEHDACVQRRISEAFPKARHPIEGIDRGALAEVVFADKEKLLLLQEILYPSVGRETDRLTAEPTEASATFIEAINVVEGPSGGDLDGLWIVEAEVEVMIQRVVVRGDLAPSDVRARLAMQAGPSSKAAAFRCLHPDKPITRILNNGTLSCLRERVAGAWESLASGSSCVQSG